MAEPRVGMQFGSYNSATKSVKFNSTSNHDICDGNNGLFKMTEQHQKLPNGGDNAVALAINIDDNSHARAAAVLDTVTSSQIIYKGETNSYKPGCDIPFDVIGGYKTYAVDLNKNGYVDKNEIFNHGEGPRTNTQNPWW